MKISNGRAKIDEESTRRTSQVEVGYEGVLGNGYRAREAASRCSGYSLEALPGHFICAYAPVECLTIKAFVTVACRRGNVARVYDLPIESP